MLIVRDRCPYFRHMLTGEYMESTSERPIVISDVSYDTFVLLLEFLYTDQVPRPPPLDTVKTAQAHAQCIIARRICEISQHRMSLILIAVYCTPSDFSRSCSALSL